MRRYNVFRKNIDMEFLLITHACLCDVLKDFDRNSRVSIETIDRVEEVRDTLAEILEENEEGDNF
jgi:hypothetical protein